MTLDIKHLGKSAANGSVKFRQRKQEKRLPVLVAHAIFPISTEKLKWFNNKYGLQKNHLPTTVPL